MSNIINSTILRMNSFPGHAGIPGKRGGSLPRGSGSSSGSCSINAKPSESGSKRKGSHSFSNNILNREGVNLDANADTVYLNSESHRSQTVHYREKDSNGEYQDKTGTQTYNWGSIQFGTPGNKDGKGWSDKFSISGNYKGGRPNQTNHAIQVSVSKSFDEANYHWAYSDDKVNYSIVREGKVVEKFKASVPKEATQGNNIAVPCKLLERITTLNKDIKPQRSND